MASEDYCPCNSECNASSRYSSSPDQRTSADNHALKEHYTPVLVIGNGPSGICLSYILSGNWPYFTGEPHPNPILQLKLEGNEHQSILECELDNLSEGLEGRSHNPVALLFDTLSRPGADLGEDEKSRLEWRHQQTNAVDHIVLGTGKPGGSWWEMDDSVLTLSLGAWMEMPDMSFDEWAAEYREIHKDTMVVNNQQRATLSEVAHYYQDYVKTKKLDDNFVPYTKVLSIRRLKGRRVINDESGEPEIRCQRCCKLEGENLFEVKGEHIDPHCGCRQQFTVLSPNVVLATGMMGKPNRLNVPGDEFRYVRYDLKYLESAIQEGELSCQSYPVLVIGSGLSAADAILMARNAGVPVVHVFRRSPWDSAISLSKLPKVVYPEYYRVLQMMRGELKEEGYTPFPKHQVLDFSRDFLVTISGSDVTQHVAVSMVTVLIGAKPDLSFLPGGGVSLGEESSDINCKNNPVSVDPITMETEAEPGLYAMGPLVGDTFVRFASGGALAIASHLVKKKCCQNSCCMSS
ncbi:oxidative stress-induced growth inhibitor 1-like [Lytechinus variegatus]|uniref:oxidative stress-induced growth inhibitor 1-like n=1 Tax=Lytechinus variegatus TaxID=7654 RepID=UPI001BB10677|nr:oxidative stress-induced growth inhibitor 1-like [Lytechinus variegatus]XP_041454070.1 oxidative stress-induced growth inhibitor 1-like [Lytechinus variegatus]